MAKQAVALAVATLLMGCLAAPPPCADANTCSDTKPLGTNLLQIVAATDADFSVIEAKTDGTSGKKECLGVGYEKYRSDTSLVGEITICDGVTTIPFACFMDCSGVTKVNFPAGLRTIEYGAFARMALTHVIFPDGLETILPWTFDRNYDLHQVYFPDSIKRIEGYAFHDCDLTGEVRLPDALEYLGQGAFDNNPGITKIYFGNGPVDVDGYVWRDCTALTEVVFGTGVKRIRDYAFKGSGLSGEVILPVPRASVQVSSLAFAGTAGPVQVKYLEDLPPTPPPTGSPTGSPSSSPTEAPPSSSPTSSPTGSPSSSPIETSASAFGDPHLKNIKKETFEVLQPGVYALLNVPQGAAATGALLRVDASIEREASGCSPLFIRRLDILGHWLGSVPQLGFSVGVSQPGEADGAGLRVGNSSALAIEEFMSLIPPGMVKFTVPSKDVAAPSAVNKHATMMAATMNFGPGVNVKVSWTWERTPTAALASSLWVAVTGLSKVRETIGGLLGFDDHLHASRPEASCVREVGSELLRLPGQGVEFLAAASME